MKPVAIFRYAEVDGPAYFSTYLTERGIPQQLIRIDAGESVPSDPRMYSGIACMGGPMSANDLLPWIAPMLEFLRRARAARVPVIGHCLGGQLMARAYGGEVIANPRWEIGWGLVQIADSATAHEWFGGGVDDASAFLSFHWHGEAFTLPAGAVNLASSAHCVNQAFALEGIHLGLQCHIEMQPAGIRAWTRGGGHELRERAGLGTQSAAEISAAIDDRARALSRVATRLYDRWAAGLLRA